MVDSVFQGGKRRRRRRMVFRLLQQRCGQQSYVCPLFHCLLRHFDPRLRGFRLKLPQPPAGSAAPLTPPPPPPPLTLKTVDGVSAGERLHAAALTAFPDRSPSTVADDSKSIFLTELFALRRTDGGRDGRVIGAALGADLILLRQLRRARRGRALWGARAPYHVSA